MGECGKKLGGQNSNSIEALSLSLSPRMNHKEVPDFLQQRARNNSLLFPFREEKGGLHASFLNREVLRNENSPSIHPIAFSVYWKWTWTQILFLDFPPIGGMNAPILNCCWSELFPIGLSRFKARPAHCFRSQSLIYCVLTSDGEVRTGLSRALSVFHSSVLFHFPPSGFVVCALRHSIHHSMSSEGQGNKDMGTTRPTFIQLSHPRFKESDFFVDLARGPVGGRMRDDTHRVCPSPRGWMKSRAAEKVCGWKLNQMRRQARMREPKLEHAEGQCFAINSFFSGVGYFFFIFDFLAAHGLISPCAPWHSHGGNALSFLRISLGSTSCPRGPYNRGDSNSCSLPCQQAHSSRCRSLHSFAHERRNPLSNVSLDPSSYKLLKPLFWLLNKSHSDVIHCFVWLAIICSLSFSKSEVDWYVVWIAHIDDIWLRMFVKFKERK